jgi:hypothetical protein
MEVFHPRCCGIDVHQASLAVRVAIIEDGKSEKHKLRWDKTSMERAGAPRSHPQLNRNVQRQGPHQEMTTSADAMLTFERAPKSRTPKFSSS